MEIFKLFGRIMVDNSGAVDNIKDTEKKAEDAAKAFDEMAGQAGVMAGAVAAAGVAIVTAIGVKAVMAADELQKSMSRLQAQTGASDADMKKFKETALALYDAGAGQSIEDIAQAMSELSRTTGLSGAELEKTTKNALALRDTFDFDVRASADAANSLIKQFGISAEEAYTLMAQGAQQGANKNGDLLEVMSEYSVQFKSLGFSAEQFTNVLIDGANNGAFKIDAVGDAMKEFNIVSKDGSKATAAAFEGLGLNADQMTKAFASGGETAQEAFTTVMQKLAAIDDPVKKNIIGVGLFKSKYEDLEAGAIKALGNIESKTDQNADTLKKIDDTKTSTFGEQLVLLGRQLETNLFIPLGEKIAPKLKEFTDWIKENSPQIKEVLGGAVDTLAGFFNGLSDALKFVIDNFKIFGPILAGVTGMIIAQYVIGTLIPMYKLWRASTVGMTLAQAALNAVMALNPFTWIALAIGAVIAAVVAIIFYWDEIKAAAKATWNWLASFFKTKVGMIVAIMGGPITMALAIIANWETIKTKAALIWDAVVYKVKTFVSKFRSYFQNLRSRVAEIMQGMQDFFKTKIGRIVAILGGPITIGLAIIANWQKIKAKAIEIWDGIVDKFQTVRDKIKGFFTSIRDSIKNSFNALWDIIKSPLNFIIGGINTFIQAYEGMINKVADLIDKIPDFKLPKQLGGFGFSIPDFPRLEIDNIPLLADGGTIKQAGTVIVGEKGPELLTLPRAAQVTPLDKTGQSIVININDAKVFNERDGERLGELIVKSLKLKGIVPRGV